MIGAGQSLPALFYEEFVHRFAVVAVDYRGAGDSGRPAGGYDKSTPLTMPVPAMGGELDNGQLIGAMARDLAQDVRTHIVPGGGHWTPEENPDFLAAKGGSPAS
jgi:pimeloyl-ACP methyl ester carboxylesterase